MLPNAGKNPDAFYDPKSGERRLEFHVVYRTDLRVLDNVSGEAARNGAEVIAILARDTT